MEQNKVIISGNVKEHSHDFDSTIEELFFVSTNEIGKMAFHKNYNLKRVDFNGVDKIGKFAFNRCYSLTDLINLDSVKFIDSGAFRNCSMLSIINLSRNIGYIGGEAFMGTAIVNFNMPDTITDIKGDTFRECLFLSDITLSKNLRNIGPLAFACCNSLRYIEIPDSVEYVDSTAFLHCYNLKEIKCNDRIKNQIERVKFNI